MPVRHIAVDPWGGIHYQTGSEEAFTHCVAVRPSYAAALANARMALASYRYRYEFLISMANGTFDTTGERRWRSRIGADPRYASLRSRAATHLQGARTYEEYLDRLIARNVGKVEQLNTEGYYDRWSAVLWTASLEMAEQEGAARALREEFTDVAVLEVTAEWYPVMA